MNPHWPKVQQWQRDDSMLDGIVGLLQQSFPETTRGLRSLLGGPQSLLADDRLAPRPPANNLPVEEIVTSPRAMNGSLQEIATMVANDDKVPVDFIINEVIDPIAYHESHNYVKNSQNPGIRQGVRMSPTQLQAGGGPGRGMFQFEGKRGVQKAVLDAAGNKKKDKEGNVIMGDDSFDIALKRASKYFTNKNMQIPSWVTDIQPGQDATSLTGDQQKALAILNFKGMANRPNKIEANFGKLYEKFQGPSRSDFNKSLGEFWKTYHHRKAGEEDKIKDFNSSLTIYNDIPGR